MGSRKKPTPTDRKYKPKPAESPEARLNQLVAKAFDLVERRLDEGTATSQETTTLMKYGSPKAELERQKLQTEIDALNAKIAVLESSKRSEELYEKAIKAFATYSGHSETLDEFEELK